MGFKMKGFSYPGKSPAKQVPDYTAGMVGAEEIKARGAKEKEYQRLLEEENERLQSKKGKKVETLSREEEKQQNIEQYDTGEVDEVSGEPIMDDLQEGWDYSKGTDFVDPTMSQYKSKAEIRKDKRNRRLKSKTNIETEEGKFLGMDTGVTKQYTKEEKHRDKIANLADKYQRARGTGKTGMTFNWKKALLGGGGIMGGFERKAKKDILAKKIKKKESKYKAKQTRKKGKEERKKIRREAREKKEENLKKKE